MQNAVPDTDLYERKIYKLEKDIVTLNEELNATRIKLRSA
jgi:hypothetical protein